SFWAALAFFPPPPCLPPAPFLGTRGISSPSSSSMSLSASFEKLSSSILRPLQGCLQPELGLLELDSSSNQRTHGFLVAPRPRVVHLSFVHANLGVPPQNPQPRPQLARLILRVGDAGDGVAPQRRRHRRAQRRVDAVEPHRLVDAACGGDLLGGRAMQLP